MIPFATHAMSIRIFEQPVETAESPQQVEASLAARLLFCAWASLIVLVPALAATYSAWQLTNLFRGMTNAEDVSTERILTQLSIFNMPLIVGLLVAALLAFVLAIVLAAEPRRRAAAVGLPFSIVVPILAALPGLLLWRAETSVIDVLTGKITDMPVVAVAQNISLLIFSALASGLIVQAATLLCAIVSLCIPAKSRTEPYSMRRAFVWGVSGTLLLIFAGAYFILV